MPPLHEALVDVHKEYAKASWVAKDVADLYRMASTATDVLNAPCTASQAENQCLSEQFQQTEEQLKKTREEFLQEATTRRPSESKQELQNKLQQAEEALKRTEVRSETFENRSKALEDQQQSAQTEFGKQLQEKEDMIWRLCRQLANQHDAARQIPEQIEELEEYVKIQESYFED